MKRLLVIVILLGSNILIACSGLSSAAGGGHGPVIGSLRASTKGFSIDCAPTSVTVTAHITDSSGIAHAQLLYRVGSDGPYSSVDMAELQSNDYTATVQGVTLGTDKYGVWEFYISAANTAGSQSQSAPDTTVQFLPCVH